MAFGKYVEKLFAYIACEEVAQLVGIFFTHSFPFYIVDLLVA